MAGYENLRRRTIEENKRKMEELRLKPLAYEAMSLMKGNKKQKDNNTMKSKQVFEDDDDYTPEEGDHLEQSTEDDDIELVQTIQSLRSRSKKVIASRGGNSVMSVEKPQFSNTSMASLVKTRSQTQKRLLQQRKEERQHDMNSLQTTQQENVLPPLAQQVHSEQNGRSSSQAISHLNLGMVTEKSLRMRSQQVVENTSHAENNTNAKKGQSKTMVAPGTLGVFLRMREKSIENERLSKQIDDFGQPTERSQKRQASCSDVQLFEDESSFRFGLVNGDEGSQRLDHYVVEEEQDADPIVQKTNEPIPVEDQQTDQLGKVSPKKKRTRGPTTCKDVHGWTLNDRKPIILNEMGQPIGPDDATLDKFSQFLGSLSRDSSLAPLNKIDWRHVPSKDKIWDYVKTKFIISEEGKNYVLSSVGALWRSYKARIKKKHYTMYDNEEDRWENRPKSIPNSHFEDLLEYWNLDEVQEVSQKNKERSEGQKDRHTMGHISFARKRHELEQAENKPPSKAVMYKETRKRKEGRRYKTTYMEKVPESRKSRLLGTCTKKGNQPSKPGVLIPHEVLQPFEAQIVKKTLGEVVKFLKDQIPSETLASITSSLNGQSFGGINDAEQYQNAVDEDNGANDDDGVLEENEDKIENEEGDHED